jgi:PAS domain S-box-containing protein
MAIRGIVMQENNQKYVSIVEDQRELVCRYLPDCTLTFVNQAYCRYHEKSQDELIGKSFLPSVRPNNRQVVLNFIKLASPKNPLTTEIQQITKSSGEVFWVEWHRRALFDVHENLIEIQSVGRDVTEYKETAEALKASEEDLRRKNIELERKNNALTEVLGQIEYQKMQIKEDVIANVEELLLPALDQLISKGSKTDNVYLNLIKRSLQDLTSSFGRKITQNSFKLTPKETQICNMVKRGLSSKEISSFLNISLFTVGRHRHNIRKKLNITNKSFNLHAFLQDL